MSVVAGARHGTYLGYSSDGCRCDQCRAAKAAYSRARREAGLEKDRRGSHRRRVEVHAAVAAERARWVAWLVEVAYGYDFHCAPHHPPCTAREYVSALRLSQGASDPVEAWLGSLEAECGWADQEVP